MERRARHGKLNARQAAQTRAHSKTQQIREDDMTVIWRGTSTESQSLLDAVNRNCGCEFGWALRRTWCAAHRMLVEDQRALDGLLFARRIAGRLRREEWMNTCELLPTGVLTGSDGVLASAGHHIGQ
jgi:hypothetical protein